MFEYGALFNGSLAEQVRSGIYDLITLLKNIPIYWYAVAIVLFFLFVRLLTRRI